MFKEVTMEVNAPPTITPTAMSSTFPLVINFLNSAIKPFPTFFIVLFLPFPEARIPIGSPYPVFSDFILFFAFVISISAPESCLFLRTLFP